MALCCARCFEYCFGKRESETTLIYPKPNSINQPIRTVRRISSVGQTVIDENGEEKEIPRHSNILETHITVPVPRYTPTPIQPGVTKEDLMMRIKTLPTIAETPKSKPKTWKKVLPKKGNYSPVKVEDKEKKKENHVQLNLFSSTFSKSTELISSHDEDQKLEVNKLKRNEFSDLRRGSYGSSPNLSSILDDNYKANSDSTSASNYTLTSSIYSEKTDESKLLSPLNRSSRFLNSQSIENVDKSEVKSPAEIAKQYGLDLSLYTQPLDYTYSSGSSKSSISNLFTEKADGTIELVASYQQAVNQLTVLIKRIEGLCGAGTTRDVFSSVIKLGIIGEKKQGKSGKKLAPGLSPLINQYFAFHLKDLNTKMLRISIYNSNFLGRYDAIGHALLSLAGIKDEHSFTLKFHRASQIATCPAVLDLQFFYVHGSFHLTVRKIINLLDKYKKCKLQLKIAHYGFSKKIKEKVFILPSNNDLDTLNYNIKFRLTVANLKHDYIILTLKSIDQTMFKKHDKTIGHFYLGPNLYYEDGSLSPWGLALLYDNPVHYNFKMYL